MGKAQSSSDQKKEIKRRSRHGMCYYRNSLLLTVV
jgi:hypothetical protein